MMQFLAVCCLGCLWFYGSLQHICCKLLLISCQDSDNTPSWYDLDDVLSQAKTAVEEALEWLDDNQDAEEDDYREKLKEVEDVCSPIVSSAYQAGGGPGGDDDDLDSHDEL